MRALYSKYPEASQATGRGGCPQPPVTVANTHSRAHGRASAITLASFVLLQSFAYAADTKVTYVNDVLPILRTSCLNCHNPDKDKAGLDMTTYQGIMAGSDTRKVIVPGNSANSVLFKCVTHAETPTMPPKSDKIPDSQIEILRKWIDGNALETPDSKAVIAKDTGPALEMFAQEKADGPPPIPRDLLLEPVVKTGRAGSVVSMAASPRAPIVAVAAQKQVLIYNTDTMDLVGVLPFPEGFPEVVKFSRDGRLVIAGGGIGAKSGRVVVWDVTTGMRVMEAGDEFDAVLAADISPDRHFIALGGPNRMVKIFKDGKLLFSIKKHTDWVTALAFTSDGKMLISGDRQGGLHVWETSSGTELFMLTSLKGGVTAIASPGPQTCITSGEDGTVKLWDLREGKEIKSWEAHKGGTLSVTFSPDGRLVTSGRDKIVRLWSGDGNKLKEFEPFSDVALSAAISKDKVIAGDWTGTIRIWNAADGKRLAEMTPNPPLLAERLATATARIAELQQAKIKTAALLPDAEKAFAQSSADARTAAEAAAGKEKEMQAASAQVAALAKAAGESDAALKKAGADYAQLQAATQMVNTELSRAIAANDAAQHDEKADGNMQEKQAHLAQLADAAKAAQAQADGKPGDPALADAAAKAKAELDKATEDFAADQKAAATAETSVQHAKDALAKANDAVAANKDGMQSLQAKMKELTATSEKAHATLATAQQSLTVVKADYDIVSKALPPKAAQAKDAEDKLSKAKRDAVQIDHDLAVATSDELKWKAAELNITLFAAKKELAARQADRQKLADAALLVSADVDKANADLAAAQKSLADAPQVIKSKEDAIAQATQAVDKAKAAAGAAREALAQKQSLVDTASAQVVTLTAQAAQAPDDTAIHDSAAKARMSLALLNKDMDPARQAVTARDADIAKAVENVATAQKALEQAKSDAAAIPATIAKLRTTVDEAATRTAKARAVADKATAAADKPVALAQAKVDAIAKDYDALCRQAQAANPPVAELTKK